MYVHICTYMYEYKANIHTYDMYVYWPYIHICMYIYGHTCIQCRFVYITKLVTIS